jgi:hypothetical protein
MTADVTRAGMGAVTFMPLAWRPWRLSPGCKGAGTAGYSLARSWSQFMTQYPLVLSPVWTQLPFEVGVDVAAPENVAATGQMSRPVPPTCSVSPRHACRRAAAQRPGCRSACC